MRDREFRLIDAVVGVVLVAVLVIAVFVASTASAAITEITVAAAPAVTYALPLRRLRDGTRQTTATAAGCGRACTRARWQDSRSSW